MVCGGVEKPQVLRSGLTASDRRSGASQRGTKVPHPSPISILGGCLLGWEWRVLWRSSRWRRGQNPAGGMGCVCGLEWCYKGCKAVSGRYTVVLLHTEAIARPPACLPCPPPPSPVFLQPLCCGASLSILTLSPGQPRHQSPPRWGK